MMRATHRPQRVCVWFFDAKGEKREMYDVAIIGGGVTGCAIARELSRYDVKIVLLEKNSDVATGASKANSGIVHAGYDCVPNTLMAKLNVRGSKIMESLCADLSVPYKRNGSYVLAFDDEDMETLEKLMAQGMENGVEDMTILSPKEAVALEPNLNPDIKGALHAPTAAICCPYELTIALAENAVENSAEVRLNWGVTKIEKSKDAFILENGEGDNVTASHVVNAAGIYADEVSRIAGAEDFKIIPRKGEYILLDKGCDVKVNKVLFQPPSKMGKGVLVSPTVHGNIFAGPSAEDMEDKDDRTTSVQALEDIRSLAHRSVPHLEIYNTITQFAGIRSVLDGNKDFKIEASEKQPGFVQAAGICSPGLSSAPAIAEMIKDILGECGLTLNEKQNFVEKRYKPTSFREMSNDDRNEAIKSNPLYGRVICRCETVTEAEIVAAIHANIPPAITVDAIKRRTRSGMGRCQGGFCGPRIMDIICHETGMDRLDIKKFGGDSWMVSEEIKKVGEEA